MQNDQTILNQEKKRILITGSNGLLGQKLTDLYRTLPGISLLATGIGPDRYPHQEGYRYAEMDITSESDVQRIFEEFKPDTVINTAAMTNVDACETQQELCRQLNVVAPGILARASRGYDAHLIHISTDFIFPGTKKLYTEEDEPEPLSVYGKSKWEGEQQVMQHAGQWTIVRTIIVFGVAHNLSRSNTVLWAYNMLKDQAPSKVVDDQFRTPTLAEDLAMGCRLIEQKNATGIYNISGNDFMSIHELVLRVAKHFRFSTDHVSIVKTESLNQPAKRPPITGLDITKARRDLGFEPRSFEECLDIFVKQLEESKG